MVKTEKRERLENVYQDIAFLIEKHAHNYHVYDDAYPKLIIKHDSDNGRKYEIIIKEVK